MDLSSPGPNKKNKGITPSKEDASSAMDLIKQTEQITNEETLKKEAEEAEFEQFQNKIKAEAAMVKLAQEKIKRTLRENLKKKELNDIKENAIKYIESGGKVKWKSNGQGNTIQGFYKDKLIFEIKKGMTVFNLYIKDKTVLKEQNLRSSYMGCAMSISKLKIKSEDFISKLQKLKKPI